MKEVVFCFVALYYLPLARCGFTSGAPCHQFNTALLNPFRPIWPRDPVTCVDMTNMGKTPLNIYVDKIRNATTIYAQDMMMTRLPIEAIKQMPNLELLDASSNRIQKVDRRTFLKNEVFSILVLSDNNVMLRRNGPFLTSGSLTTLHLSGNHIKRIPLMAFTELPKLKVLFLDSNLLIRIHPKVFRPLANLKYLHLGDNNLVRIPSQTYLPKSLVVYITKGNPAERFKVID